MQKLNIAQLDIKILQHAFNLALKFERSVLDLADNQKTLIREIYMGYTQQSFKPLIFARSIIPESSLEHENNILLNLGTRSLGEILFNHPAMQRKKPHIMLLQPGNPLYQTAVSKLKNKPEIIWGRYSIFNLNNKPLLVQEFFLPHCLQLIEQPLLQTQHVTE